MTRPVFQDYSKKRSTDTSHIVDIDEFRTYHAIDYNNAPRRVRGGRMDPVMKGTASG
ncbi:hypothetical protein GCM10027278_06700 [Paralcaligenes ginsengisoli]